MGLMDKLMRRKAANPDRLPPFLAQASQDLEQAVLQAVVQPAPGDQHAVIDRALQAVSGLRRLPDLRPGALARIILAEEQLKRLRDLCPRFPAHPAFCEPEPAARVERGCPLD